MNIPGEGDDRCVWTEITEWIRSLLLAAGLMLVAGLLACLVFLWLVH
jgi:hypothetical protein